MNITFIAILVLLFVHFAYTIYQIKKDLHILQLNSYYNRRHLHWLLNNWSSLFSRKKILPFIAIPLVLIYPRFIVLLYLGCVYLFLIITSGEKTQNKKPLVFTARAVRIYGISLLLLLFFEYFTYTFLTKSITTDFEAIIAMVVIGCLSFIILFMANLLLLPLEKFINNYYFQDARKRLASLKNLTIIGITGSFGKTSTKHILNEILRHKFNILALPGSFNTPMGIAKIVRSGIKPTHEIFVAELSAKKIGDIAELCCLVKPKFGVITAIGEQHLETFKTLENIKYTKNELIECLPEDGTAFFNMDNEHCRDLAYHTKKHSVYYGIDSENLHYCAHDINVDSRGSKFTITKNDGNSMLFQTRLLGKHNIYNILAAISVASELGIELKDMVYPIRNLQPVEHRLELRKIGPGATLLDDTFNSNPIGSQMALEVLNKIPGTRKIIITPGMIELGEKQQELNKNFGEYIAEVCNYAILVGKNQSLPIQQGLENKNFPKENCYIADDFQDAYQYLLGFLQKDDVVLMENDLPIDS